MQHEITAAEPWSLPNLVGGVLLFVLFVLLVSYVMARATRE